MKLRKIFILGVVFLCTFGCSTYVQEEVKNQMMQSANLAIDYSSESVLPTDASVGVRVDLTEREGIVCSTGTHVIGIIAEYEGNSYFIQRRSKNVPFSGLVAVNVYRLSNPHNSNLTIPGDFPIEVEPLGLGALDFR